MYRKAEFALKNKVVGATGRLLIQKIVIIMSI